MEGSHKCGSLEDVSQSSPFKVSLNMSVPMKLPSDGIFETHPATGDGGGRKNNSTRCQGSHTIDSGKTTSNNIAVDEISPVTDEVETVPLRRRERSYTIESEKPVTWQSDGACEVDEMGFQLLPLINKIRRPLLSDLKASSKSFNHFEIPRENCVLEDFNDRSLVTVSSVDTGYDSAESFTTPRRPRSVSLNSSNNFNDNKKSASRKLSMSNLIKTGSGEVRSRSQSFSATSTRPKTYTPFEQEMVNNVIKKGRRGAVFSLEINQSVSCVHHRLNTESFKLFKFIV